uniref:Uncharacterized protein n=1 Tax=Anguilla anguilla TaxID=7936 RepID=A0A0E9SAG4_ANGAN
MPELIVFFLSICEVASRLSLYCVSVIC